MAGFQPAVFFECARSGLPDRSDQGSLFSRNEIVDRITCCPRVIRKPAAAVNSGASERL
jgi:hypothetical protein